jgi:hypothetical protein
MFYAVTLVLFFLMGALIALTPVPEPELLAPEPMTATRLLASLLPGWIARRRARVLPDTMEDAYTIAWLTRVKQTDPDRFTIGIARRGELADIPLMLPEPLVPPWSAATPWSEAPPPRSKSSSMIPDHVAPAPVESKAIVPVDPPAEDSDPVPEPEFWWMDHVEPATLDQPSAPRPWQAGDSADPPTIVRGLRAILDDDLGPYLEEMPGYGEK